MTLDFVAKVGGRLRRGQTSRLAILIGYGTGRLRCAQGRD